VQTLLEQGELGFSLVNKELGNDSIVSAILQPFCNAAEIMIYICLALTAEEGYIGYLFNKNFNLRIHNEQVENPDLRAVISEYINNRNISAHSCQLIPIDAAQMFIRRTYEIIQRLELIINPGEY